MIVPSRSALWAYAACAAAIFSTATAQSWNNVTTPLSFFYSRPDLQPPAMNVTLHNKDLVTPGYVFIAPYQVAQAGPYIYDKLGNLVWSGFGAVGAWNVHNMYVCSYNGSDHICMFQGNQLQGYARGHGIILDTNYQIVQTVESGTDLTAADQHEFRLVDGGETALITVFQQVPYDLSKINITSQGWVMDGVVQAVNIATGAVEFEWSALNHVAPWGSYVYPGKSDISGDGLTSQTAWDYFHVNSVDKSNLTGNYLVSSRHMSTIYNINATDGSIIWTLQAGGTSSFACKGFNFSFQHDAQIQAENATAMVISIYDNAFNNYNSSSPESSGKTILLDFTAMTAVLLAPPSSYPSSTGLLSASQGNTQILSNGNTFHGWGSWPYFSEHLLNGTAIWAANIGPLQGSVMSYRAYSAPWVSIPSNTKPSLWSFSRVSDGLVAFYVSWNGCTEVQSWNFYGANNEKDVFKLIGNTQKSGFETKYISDTHYMYSFVEAISFTGGSLRNSSIQQTFIPGAILAGKCSDSDCDGPDTTTVSYAPVKTSASHS